MKKNKIKIGQCYQEYGQSHIFMIVEGPFKIGVFHSEYWMVEDTINKVRWPEYREFILTCQRPFNNCG